jgi:hypothetical protein
VEHGFRLRQPGQWPALEVPDSSRRFPPAGASRVRPRFIDVRYENWRTVGANQLEFDVIFKEISGSIQFKDDFRFERLDGVWKFSGHVSGNAPEIAADQRQGEAKK